jgi:hypothetical protein
MDKRDNSKPSSNGVEDNKRVKGRRLHCMPLSGANYLPEKSSFNALAKGPSSAGHWRPATCKLSEEGERCLLNIYLDVRFTLPSILPSLNMKSHAKESILYQTLYIHLLNHTDIRPADTSVFFLKECLGIYCVAYVLAFSSATKSCLKPFPADNDGVRTTAPSPSTLGTQTLTLAIRGSSC